MALGGADPSGYEGGMDTTWHTKWGARRVRKDPPTIEEALIAAESMTDDLAQRIEIAASLIGASVEEVKVLAATGHLSRGRSTLVTGRNRASWSSTTGRERFAGPARRGADPPARLAAAITANSAARER